VVSGFHRPISLSSIDAACAEARYADLRRRIAKPEQDGIHDIAAHAPAKQVRGGEDELAAPRQAVCSSRKVIACSPMAGGAAASSS
jgi:hypothetical protein